MVIPPPPADEERRLARLAALDVMDSEPEPLFDHLAALAAQLCGTPVALLGLIDERRQWFKARVGFGRGETPRERTFCAHTLLADGLFEINDARLDERFFDHPDVVGDPPLRFYAGVPIRLDDGSHPGTLCVVDYRPRELSEAQREALTRLAGAAAEALMMRERMRADRQALLDRTGRIAGIGGWSLDLGTRELVWSDQACRLHDLEPGHRPTLEAAFSYYKPEARATVQAAVEQGMREGRPWSLELPLVTAAGREIWVLVQGQADVRDGVPVRLVGAIQDVTEHHRAAVELEHSRRRLRAMYEATPALMHSVDPAGRVLSVSDRWLRSLGYRREQVVGRLVDDFITPESLRLLRELYRPAMWRDGHVDNCPLQLICADGRLLDALVSAVAEYDAEGRPLRALALVDDITDELRHRAELAQEQRMRRQIERHAQELDQLLHERSEMLDVLAHEVRQPLNNASAALQSATASLAGRGEHQAQEKLTRAQAVLGQVLAGVDNTLAAASLLAGGGRLERLDTDIDTLIAVTIADLPREQRDRIVVRRHTATRTALMDMSLLRLALRNLLSNGLKYAPGLSPVVLHVIDFDEPAALQFEIADAGPGIPRELLPRLFTRGARGQGSTEPGHGLGLYIVRRVMDLHGGSAELVRSGPLGTVMRLTLPQR
jgi:PAS domain S-box-containing protein